MLNASSRHTRNRQAQQRQQPIGSGLLRRIGWVLLLATLVVASLPISDADAQPPEFDRELIELVNEWRVSKGLDRYVADSGLSERALQWSQFMASGRGDCTDRGGQNYGHSDTSAASALVPPGTNGVGENINWVCGPSNGVIPPWSTAAGPLPEYCQPSMDNHSPEALMCSWLASAGHRASIEHQQLTHIGSGTVTVGSGELTQTFSTHVFTISSLPRFDANCDGMVSIQDAVAIAQYTVGSRTGVNSCALDDSSLQINAAKSDLNSDGRINILDAFFAAQCIVGNFDCD